MSLKNTINAAILGLTLTYSGIAYAGQGATPPVNQTNTVGNSVNLGDGATNTKTTTKRRRAIKPKAIDQVKVDLTNMSQNYEALKLRVDTLAQGSDQQKILSTVLQPEVDRLNGLYQQSEEKCSDYTAKALDAAKLDTVHKAKYSDENTLEKRLEKITETDPIKKAELVTEIRDKERNGRKAVEEANRNVDLLNDECNSSQGVYNTASNELNSRLSMNMLETEGHKVERIDGRVNSIFSEKINLGGFVGFEYQGGTDPAFVLGAKVCYDVGKRIKICANGGGFVLSESTLTSDSNEGPTSVDVGNGYHSVSSLSLNSTNERSYKGFAGIGADFPIKLTQSFDLVLGAGVDLYIGESKTIESRVASNQLQNAEGVNLGQPHNVTTNDEPSYRAIFSAVPKVKLGLCLDDQRYCLNGTVGYDSDNDEAVGGAQLEFKF